MPGSGSWTVPTGDGMSQRYRCPVCGTVSRQPEDLCDPQPTEERCETSGGEEAAPVVLAPGLVAVPSELPESPRVSWERVQRQRALRTLEILFCPSVHQRAKHACEACGRLTTDESLVCLPHKRKQ